MEGLLPPNIGLPAPAGAFRPVAELGGYGCENTDHAVTETLIRGMYDYWRRVMQA